jgi:hypothetical protein
MCPVRRSCLTLSIVGLFVLGAASCRDRVEGRVARIVEWEREPSSRNVERIRGCLADGDGAVRAGALTALVRLGTADAKERARAALSDPDNVVRAAAVAGLLDLKDREAVPDLEKFALSDPDWRVRHGAVEVVGSLGGEGDATALLPFLADTSSQVRLAAIGAVERLGPAVALDGLAKLAESDASWEVRARAVEAMGRTSAGEAYAHLAAASRDPNEFVRAAAAAALRDLRRRGVQEPEVAGTAEPSAPGPRGPSGEAHP